MHNKQNTTIKIKVKYIYTHTHTHMYEKCVLKHTPTYVCVFSWEGKRKESLCESLKGKGNEFINIRGLKAYVWVCMRIFE